MKRVTIEEMLGFNHTLAGSILAVIIPAPIAPIAAFLSHFLLDAFPHFGRHTKFAKGTRNMKRLIVADGILCLVTLLFAWYLFPEKWLMIGLCAFLACLPDLLWIFKRSLHTPQWFLDFSSWIQWGERPWGWILDSLYAIIFVLILFSLSFSY